MSFRRKFDVMFPVRELMFLFLVVALLVIQPWLQPLSPFHADLVNAVSVFVLFLISILLQAKKGRSGACLRSIQKLFRLIPFLLGLFLCFWIFIQSINASLKYYSQKGIWWLSAQPYFSWLPNGVDAPFRVFDGYRVLMIFGTGILLGALLWIGVKQRGYLRFMQFAIVVGIGVFSLYVLLFQFLSYLGAAVDPLVFEPNFIRLSYLILVFSMGCGYTFFLLSEGSAKHFLFRAILFGGAQVCNFLFIFYYGKDYPLARSLLIGLLALFGGLLILYFFRKRFSKHTQFLLAGILFFSALLFVVVSVPEPDAQERLHEVSFQMWKDRPLLGWGAGSFRWVFPTYQVQADFQIDSFALGDPKVYLSPQSGWLEILIEYGVIGALVFIAILVYYSFSVFKVRESMQFHYMMNYLGLLLLFVSILWSSFFYNINCLMLIVFIASATLRLQYLDFKIGSRRG